MSLNIARSSALALLAGQVLSQQTFVIPPFPYPGDSNTQWVSGPDGLDAPKSQHINLTSYDWWYFDVVQRQTASGEQPSLAVTFHTTGSYGFDALHEVIPGPYPSDNFVQVDMVWPNGTTDTWSFFAGEATITVDGDGASGNFSQTGCSFEGAPDLSQYSVFVNAPAKGIVGTLQVRSDVPAHYPCGPAEAGQDMKVLPGGGWANAIPDGLGEIDFTIRGQELKFEGRGYHDHNFDNIPFSQAFAASYWGHGRLGDYAIVWVDALTPSGDNYVSAYVAQGGSIVAAHCDGIRVRPYGANSTYPPTTSTGTPTGFNLEIEIPDGRLELQAEYLHIMVDSDFYQRFTGSFTGTLNGGRLPDGVSLWEQFTLQD